MGSPVQFRVEVDLQLFLLLPFTAFPLPD